MTWCNKDFPMPIAASNFRCGSIILCPYRFLPFASSLRYCIKAHADFHEFETDIAPKFLFYIHSHLIAIMASEFNTEAFTLLGVGTAIVTLRTYARVSMVGIRRLMLDDYLMLLALVCVLLPPLRKVSRTLTLMVRSSMDWRPQPPTLWGLGFMALRIIV